MNVATTSSKTNPSDGGSLVQGHLLLASKVNPHAQLGSIRVLSASFGEKPLQEARDQTAADIATRQDYRVEDDELIVVTEIKLQMGGPVSDDEPEPRIIVFVKAKFELTYDLSRTDLPQDALERFAKINGIYNAWPYWREFVQNCTTRMALPPLIMPLIAADKAVEWSGLLSKQEPPNDPSSERQEAETDD